MANDGPAETEQGGIHNAGFQYTSSTANLVDEDSHERVRDEVSTTSGTPSTYVLLAQRHV